LVDSVNRIERIEVVNLTIYVADVIQQKEHRIKRIGLSLQNIYTE